MRQGETLRASMLDELDRAFELSDGDTPNHLIVSKEIWDRMEDGRKFEALSDDHRWSERNRPGYLGMRVWYSKELDKRGKVGLLLSEQAFQTMVTKTKDFNRSSP